jgi:hypothetical protein
MFKLMVRYPWTVADIWVKPGNKKSRIKAWASEIGRIGRELFLLHIAIIGKC